jgi:hypothetical protein
MEEGDAGEEAVVVAVVEVAAVDDAWLPVVEDAGEVAKALGAYPAPTSTTTPGGDAELLTVTATACEVVALPAPSVATAVILWVPLLVCVVSQSMVYGLEVDSPMREPSR